MPAPGTIVIVCTGNICRSPMGCGLLTHALAAQPEPLKSLPVVSAGVATRQGELASENAVLALKRVGIDISGHRTTPLTQQMLDAALAVFCMTDSHRSIIELQAAPVPKRLHLFREFLPGDVRREIADPYGGSLKLYEAARDEMVEAIPSVVDYIRSITAKTAKA
jgi:protein-tyrosine-phosphatase